MRDVKTERVERLPTQRKAPKSRRPKEKANTALQVLLLHPAAPLPLHHLHHLTITIALDLVTKGSRLLRRAKKSNESDQYFIF